MTLISEGISGLSVFNDYHNVEIFYIPNTKVFQKTAAQNWVRVKNY